MAFTDLLIVLAVFAGFGFLILSRMKEKNPKRHAALIGFFKTSKDKAKNIGGRPRIESQKIILPENSRIM